MKVVRQLFFVTFTTLFCHSLKKKIYNYFDENFDPNDSF